MKKIKFVFLCSIIAMLCCNLTHAQVIIGDDPPSMPAAIKVYRTDDGTSIGGTVTINVKNASGTLLGSQTLSNGTYGTIYGMSGTCSFNITVNAMGVLSTSAYHPVPASSAAGAEYVIFDLGTYSISVSLYKNPGFISSYTINAVQGPPLH